MSDLEEMFGESEPKKEPETQAPEEVAEPDPEAPEGDEPEGKGDKPEEPEPDPKPPAEPPAAEKSDEASAYKAAMLEERRKRQEFERRLRDLEGKQPEAPKKDFWDDPEAVIAERVGQVEQNFTVRLLRSSEAAARKRYEDYDEKLVAFQEAADKDPSLQQRMVNDDDPADFAYRVGKTYLFTKDAPDIDTLTDKIRAQVLAEERDKIRKEVEGEARQKALERVPESLSEQTGATTRQEKVKTGEAPIDSFFDN